MLAIHLFGYCPPTPPRCWSNQFRCFVARRNQVVRQAIHVLGNDRLASEWLTRPALGLGKRTPCTLLTDYEGFLQVWQHLTRIEYGVYC